MSLVTLMPLAPDSDSKILKNSVPNLGKRRSIEFLRDQASRHKNIKVDHVSTLHFYSKAQRSPPPAY
jgi:hypothetical protein